MERTIFRRVAQEQLVRLLQAFPVVVVSGARRTGKSTLVRTSDVTAAWSYRSLDDAVNREAALVDPEAFAGATTPAIIDEVQRAPDLMIAIKAVIDQSLHPAPGQFILTGSADLLNHPRITESLAGRAAYMRLGPLTRKEILGQASTGHWSAIFDNPPPRWREILNDTDSPPADWRSEVRRGGLPEMVLAATETQRVDRFLAYVDTYMERDLRDLAQVDSLPDFRRAMRAAALRSGNIFNAAELSRDIGVPQTTLKRWMDLLEISYLIVRQEAFTTNRTSRLIKSPKIYWADAGLGFFLSGAAEPEGAHLENLVLADLMVWRDLQAPRPSIMHWRTSTGREIDFVVERGNRLLAIEIKATARPAPADLRHLHAFLDEYDEDVIGGLLLHGGTEVTPVTDRIVMAPWWRVI